MSPYTIWFGVLLLAHNNLLQANRWAVSMADNLNIPHISDAYNIALICASNSFKNKDVSRLPSDHIVFIRSKMLPLALLACPLNAELFDSFVVRVNPKHL